MTNKHNGEVSLDVGGKTFNIKLTASKFATAEALLNTDSLIGKQLGFRSVQALFFLSCQGQNGLKSIDEVAEMMDTHMMPITKAVNEAVDFFYQNQAETTVPSE